MYIITSKDENVFLDYGNQLDYMKNGYPRLVEENVAYVTEQVNVFEITELPEDVERFKYCYTEEKGFYENENYVEEVPEETEEEVEETEFTEEEV